MIAWTSSPKIADDRNVVVAQALTLRRDDRSITIKPQNLDPELLDLPQTILVILHQIQVIHCASSEMLACRILALSRPVVHCLRIRTHPRRIRAIIHIDANVADHVLAIHGTDNVEKIFVEGLHARDGATGHVKGGGVILHPGRVEERAVIGIEAGEAAVQGVCDRFARAEGGEVDWVVHRDVPGVGEFGVRDPLGYECLKESFGSSELPSNLYLWPTWIVH